MVLFRTTSLVKLENVFFLPGQSSLVSYSARKTSDYKIKTTTGIGETKATAILLKSWRYFHIITFSELTWCILSITHTDLWFTLDLIGADEFTFSFFWGGVGCVWGVGVGERVIVNR